TALRLTTRASRPKLAPNLPKSEAPPATLRSGRRHCPPLGRRHRRRRLLAPVQVLTDRVDHDGGEHRDAAEHAQPDPPMRDAEQPRPGVLEGDVRAEYRGRDPDYAGRVEEIRMRRPH